MMGPSRTLPITRIGRAQRGRLGGRAIGDSAVFLFVGLVLFLLAGISEWRRRMLGEAASPFQARAPLVIGVCGLIDVVLAILLRLA